MRTRLRQRLDAARQDDLLARVVDIFLYNGFSSVTVSALAQQLRCSKATLYGVAPTKELPVNQRLAAGTHASAFGPALLIGNFIMT